MRFRAEAIPQGEVEASEARYARRRRLAARSAALLDVLGVGFGRLAGVMRGVLVVPVSHVSVVSGLVDLARFMVLRAFAVVTRGALVVIGGFLMMLDGVLHDDLQATI